MMWWLVILAVVGLLTIYLAYTSRGHGTEKFPPVRSGWLPWLGCALEFGKEPLNFIKKTKDELGHVFTIHAAGKYMTFISSPAHYDYFFHTAHADFQKAVQPYTNKAAGVSKSSFFTHHTAMHDLIKGNFIPSQLHGSCEQLSRKLYDRMVGMVTDNNEVKMDLLAFVKSVMFPCVVSHLFGDDILPEGEDEILQFQQNFFKYDENFEYGAELPEIFLRDWSKQKHWLLTLFHQLLQQRGGAETSHQSVFNKIITLVDKENAPNYALLLLWASQANATPVVFWALCFILSHPQIHQELSQELASVLPPIAQLGHTHITYHMIQQLPMVKRCVLEAIRLRAPGMIVRKVTQTHKLEDYTIPEGYYLMMSPYWAHRDPHLFPSPESYNPDRWRSCDLNKSQFLEGFVGFGGGRYQCPGRWFALMEMYLVVAMVIHMFDLKVMDPTPSPSPLHLTGSPQPNQPCHVTVNLKTM